MALTQLLEHFVALVQDEVLDVLQVELLALDESQESAGSSDDDVRAVGLQDLLLFGDGEASEEHADLK